MKPIKCVLIGDAEIGKTWMVTKFTMGRQPAESITTTVDNYSIWLDIDGKDKELEIYDTPGLEIYDRLRPLYYPKMDVFLICFSVMNSDSFRNVELKWLPEVQLTCPSAKIILVGTKNDLRDDNEALEKLKNTNEIPVTYDQGVEMAKQINAVKYLECSALNRVSLVEVFEPAGRSVLVERKSKQKVGGVKGFAKRLWKRVRNVI